MLNVRSIAVTGCAALTGLLALSACKPARSHEAAAAAEPAGAATKAARSDSDVLPPDGQELFDFLLAEIPEVVDRVPCSCCSYNVGYCFRGACPPTCGPCNSIGRDVYAWHKEGKDVDTIIKLVYQAYPDMKTRHKRSDPHQR